MEERRDTQVISGPGISAVALAMVSDEGATPKTVRMMARATVGAEKVARRANKPWSSRSATGNDNNTRVILARAGPGSAYRARYVYDFHQDGPRRRCATTKVGDMSVLPSSNGTQDGEAQQTGHAVVADWRAALPVYDWSSPPALVAEVDAAACSDREDNFFRAARW